MFLLCIMVLTKVEVLVVGALLGTTTMVVHTMAGYLSIFFLPVNEGIFHG